MMDILKAFSPRNALNLLPGLLAAFIAFALYPSMTNAEPAKPLSIVAFGDSLTAGYGLQASQSFAAQLQMALTAKGHKVEIINGGVSGDTTAAGLERLEWSVPDGTQGVVLELGANDALRGIDPKETRANLDRIITTLKGKGIDVLIAGMRSPANWGDAYAKDFDSIFPDLAAKYNLKLYPFFLEGVALDKKLVLADGLHPTAEGVAEVVKRILPDVETLIATIKSRQPAAH